MVAKSNAIRQAERRERERTAGLKRVLITVPISRVPEIQRIAKTMREETASENQSQDPTP